MLAIWSPTTTQTTRTSRASRCPRGPKSPCWARRPRISSRSWSTTPSCSSRRTRARSFWRTYSRRGGASLWSARAAPAGAHRPPTRTRASTATSPSGSCAKTTFRCSTLRRRRYFSSIFFYYSSLQVLVILFYIWCLYIKNIKSMHNKE